MIGLVSGMPDIKIPQTLPRALRFTYNPFVATTPPPRLRSAFTGRSTVSFHHYCHRRTYTFVYRISLFLSSLYFISHEVPLRRIFRRLRAENRAKLPAHFPSSPVSHPFRMSPGAPVRAALMKSRICATCTMYSWAVRGNIKLCALPRTVKPTKLT